MNDAPAWLVEILAAIRPLIPEGFVGQIEVNAFRGGITYVNVRQTFKETDRAKIAAE